MNTPSEIPAGIAELEEYTSEDNPESLDIDQLVHTYEQIYPHNPLRQLVDDLQHQAMVYANILERLKAGDQAPKIRQRFEQLGLVPQDTLPNPHEGRLYQFALGKLTRYRETMLSLIQRFGGRFLAELSMETELTVGLAVTFGFPPSISISVEHNWQPVQRLQWTARKA